MEKELESILNHYISGRIAKLKMAKSKSEKQLLIKQKNEAKFLREILNSIIEVEISKYSNIDKIVLPVNNSGYSEYRMIVDNESDKKENWTEVSLNGKPLRFQEEEILFVLKHT